MRSLPVFLFGVFVCLLVGCKQASEPAFVRASHRPGPIDSLASDKEVEAFVRKQDTLLRRFKLRPVSDYEKTELFYDQKEVFGQVRRVKPPLFIRGDFDNNGYTDLVVSGDARYGCTDTLSVCGFESILFLQSAKGTEKRYLSGWFRDLLVVYPVQRNAHNLLDVFAIQSAPTGRGPQTLTHTLLTVQEGYPIEYNPSPEPHQIEKLVFATDPCFGTCPIFTLTVQGDGRAIFRADAYNFSDEPPKATRKVRPQEHPENNYNLYRSIYNEGTYKGTIRKADLEAVFSLLNYLDFIRLRDEYAVGATDLPGATLTITYDGGKVKRIFDYGKTGTYGLQALYKKLEALRYNQKWTPRPPESRKQR